MEYETMGIYSNTAKRASALLLSAAIAACGGGGSSSGGGGDPGGPGNPGGPGGANETVPQDIIGIDRLGSNHALLYTQVLAGTDMAGLFMVNPAPFDDPGAPVEARLIDSDIGDAFFATPIATLGATNYDHLFLTFHGGVIDTSGKLAMVRPAQVLYGNGALLPGQYMPRQRVAIDESGSVPTPEQVTGQPSSPQFLSRRILNDLENPEDSFVLYDSAGSWKQFQLSDDASTPEKTLAANL